MTKRRRSVIRVEEWSTADPKFLALVLDYLGKKHPKPLVDADIVMRVMRYLEAIEHDWTMKLDNRINLKPYFRAAERNEP